MTPSADILLSDRKFLGKLLEAPGKAPRSHWEAPAAVTTQLAEPKSSHHTTLRRHTAGKLISPEIRWPTYIMRPT